MEYSLGAFPDGEWESFSKMFSAEDQFLDQFHDHEGLNYQKAPSAFFPTSEEASDSLLYSLGNIINNSSNCSSSSSIFHENYFFGDHARHIPAVANDISMSMNICLMDEKNIGSFFPAFPDHIVMGDQTKRKFDVPEEDKTNCTHMSTENTKKKPRVSRNVQKSKKNVMSKKKNQKLSQEEESNINARADGQSSSGCSSDDNASLETNGGEPSESKDSAALNLSGKTRASRGSATDPQSLYARKRRERINERLRTLQGLVPNGTKVDISTMLEEAVQYVKFLQLQIKLLSSDDMWMYAPIAYNGMDIGLISQKISPPL
ncbi:hypothetical protein SLA2020_434890 [Shorea laevis]